MPEIGIGLTAVGSFFTILSAAPFFDGALLAVGNVSISVFGFQSRNQTSSVHCLILCHTLESSEHILFQLFFLSGDGLILGFERTKNLIFQRQRLRVELPSSFSSEYVWL